MARTPSTLTCSLSLIAVLLAASSARAQAPSRAEDPNYDPDAEARARAQNSEAPYGAERDESRIFTGQGEPVAEADDEPYLEGKTLRNQVGDIVLVPWPPPARVTFALTAIYPYQAAGIGLGIEAYAAGVLRLSGFFSVGMTFDSTPASATIEPIFSTFGEASIGVRLLTLNGDIAEHVNVTDAKKDERAPTSRRLFNAWLPGTHAFLLEGGMLTGALPRVRCVADCEKEDPSQRSYSRVNPQLFYPEAGLRYVFFSRASSLKQPGVDRLWQIEVFLHLVYRPFNDVRGIALSETGDHIPQSRFGGRGGFAFPVCGHGCARLDLMAGYMPSPDTVIFSGGVSY